MGEHCAVDIADSYGDGETITCPQQICRVKATLCADGIVKVVNNGQCFQMNGENMAQMDFSKTVTGLQATK